MVYVIHAHIIDGKILIPGFSFGDRSDLADEFTKLMGVSKTVIKKVYTVTELMYFKKDASRVITKLQDRKIIKCFLTSCIESANGSYVEVMFH